MSEGYYNSKKTDDICDDVCGQVPFFSFLFFFAFFFFTRLSFCLIPLYSTLFHIWLSFFFFGYGFDEFPLLGFTGNAKWEI